MDVTSIFIIVVATVLAIVFKVILYKKIQKWMDQDLIKGLADGNSDKQAFLQQEYQKLIAQKVKRKQYSDRLTELADQFEQNS
ncbi:hypothetical protein [Neptuniibacter caesariensis]|uniref:Uncharacterized protein n=1 Tax=Neptuniibacter caesariensis TaxID=207954 RepID=A0A7U8C2W1_NEPCE|nr:hypothetical protein [Neptuniibacter caesariensis]EAR60497.1 hypothetical protein MED92_09211 [Oceanospirillum sp. MED92] [Neptuniibacter caesariensis]